MIGQADIGARSTSFTAIKGLQVIIDGPVGCENLPVTSVLHYTDGLPPHELPIVVTGLVRRGARPARHRGRDETCPRIIDPDLPAVVVTGIHRGDDRRGRYAGGDQHPAFYASHDRRGPMAERQSRHDWLWTEFGKKRISERKPRKEGERPRVNIIGPTYGTFNMPSTWPKFAAWSKVSAADVNLTFPLGSHLADVPRLLDADANICMYREFGRLSARHSIVPICRHRSVFTARPISC